jgi:4-oxalomesaconate hydratase
MNQSRTLLVVGAHAADFVWRAAGVIAVVTTHGGRANVVALSYGERGESGELWKEPNQTIDNVKRIRHEEATRAALDRLDTGDFAHKDYIIDE